MAYNGFGQKVQPNVIDPTSPSAFTNAAGGPNTNIATGTINSANSAGLFDPNGSPAIMAALRRSALRQARNRTRQSAVSSRFFGLDPTQARQAAVDTNREVSGQLADTISGGHLQETLGNRDWARGLFGSQLGNENAMAMAQFQAEQQRKLLEAQQGTFGGYLGQLVGTGLGAYTGGLGKRLAG